jgi:hypothetical protein
MDKMFCPTPSWRGQPNDFTRFDIYPWVKQLPADKKILCDFWKNWSDFSGDLVPGFDYYIISYHIENINIDWLTKQRQLVDGKFIVLFPGNSYHYQLADTEFISYIDWHNDIEKIISWHGQQSIPKKKKFKFSAVCNRITQSKIWVTTKLLETAHSESLLLHNPSNFQNKNVHNFELTGNSTLDLLTEIYVNKYKNLKLSDNFDPLIDNYQAVNSNPWQPLYTDAALHFTNGSFHYSFMMHDDRTYIYPGPDIDEKTLKCLVAGVPFIACGQFEIYKMLSSLGLNFNYGFDLSWDSDSGNLTRFEKICNLIDQLAQLSKEEIVDLTQESTLHNLEFISKKGFYEKCEYAKKISINRLLDCF